MLVLRRLVTSSAVPVVLAALAAVAACAGSSSGEDSTGGGDMVGTGTFCEAETAWQTKCGQPANACDEYVITDCAALTPLLNAGVLDAARDCLQSATNCDATPTKCLAAAAVTASGNANTTVATAAQLQIRTDYCTSCQPAGSDVCETAFFDADGPVGQASTQIVPYSDTVAAEIHKCTQAASCASSFQDCADTAVTQLLDSAVSDSAGQCVLGTFASTAPSTGDDASDGSDASVPPPFTGGDASQDSAGATDASSDAGIGEGDGGSVTCKDTYEPDDTSDTAAMLPELDDSAGTKTITASISVAGEDDDWYYYVGNDATNFTTAADPYAMVQTLSPMEVCVWAKEAGGYSIPLPQPPNSPCIAGALTAFPTPGLGYDIGCCSTSTTAQIYDYGRTGDDDSSDILMRVSQMASTLTCTDYSLTYAFKN